MDRKDINLISDIAERGLEILIHQGISVDKLDVMMDIEYTHAEIPLDLEKLFGFPTSDFSHDIIGIYSNFNRETKSMDNCFSPRCAK